MGLGEVCNTDCVTSSLWGGVRFATQTVLRPVCGVGVGCGLQHRPCYVLSVGLGWGGVCNTDCVTSCLSGWGGVRFATQTVLRPVCGVGVG